MGFNWWPFPRCTFCLFALWGEVGCSSVHLQWTELNQAYKAHQIRLSQKWYSLFSLFWHVLYCIMYLNKVPINVSLMVSVTNLSLMYKVIGLLYCPRRRFHIKILKLSFWFVIFLHWLLVLGNAFLWIVHRYSQPLLWVGISKHFQRARNPSD